MGNMQFNLDKNFDNIPCNDASDAEQVLKAISNIEGKVSIKKNEAKQELKMIYPTVFLINFVLNLVPKRA